MAYPSTRYSTFSPRPGVYTVTLDTWEIDRRGEKDCRSETVAAFTSRRAAHRCLTHLTKRAA